MWTPGTFSLSSLSSYHKDHYYKRRHKWLSRSSHPWLSQVHADILVLLSEYFIQWPWTIVCKLKFNFSLLALSALHLRAYSADHRHRTTHLSTPLLTRGTSQPAADTRHSKWNRTMQGEWELQLGNCWHSIHWTFQHLRVKHMARGWTEGKEWGWWSCGGCCGTINNFIGVCFLLVARWGQ